MEYLNAKDYFKQYETAEEEVKLANIMIDNINTTFIIGIEEDLKREPRNEELLKLHAQANQIKEKYLKAKKKAEAVLVKVKATADAIEDPLAKDIVTRRYIEGLSMEDTADVLFYSSTSYMFRKLKALDKQLPALPKLI